MALPSPAALLANVYSPSSRYQPKPCFVRLDRIQNSLAFTITSHRKGPSFWIIKSVLNNRKPSINDDEATEPARILLNRLFEQTHKTEEQQINVCFPQDGELEFNLQAALTALKTKEEHLEEAGRKISLEYHELKEAKEELCRRDEVIMTACSKQERLEEELNQANINLVSQAIEIEDLKVQLKDRDQKNSAAQWTFSLKESEMEKMMNELMMKNEEAANTKSELGSKTQLLNKANEILKKQELEIKELRNEIQEKEEALEVSMTMRKTEEEKLQIIEAKFESQTVDWLIAQEDLKKLGRKAFMYNGEANETLDDYYRRVKTLLTDVRSELVASQKALSFSRQKMEDQQKFLEKQLLGMEEQRTFVLSYMKTLRDAHIEVESERVKLRVAEGQNKELERDLLMEKELVEELQKNLKRERLQLQRANEDMFDLQNKLVMKETEFQEAQKLLKIKETELVEARLEIQHLKYEQVSFQVRLEEKDLELSNARNMLVKVNHEIDELRVLMRNRENQLIVANTMLKNKDGQVQTLLHNLDDAKLKFSEAENVVERIVKLSNDMILTIEDKHHTALIPSIERPDENVEWQMKQLESELETTRESLRSREMEILDARRTLMIKEKMLDTLQRKLDERGTELKEIKKELIRGSEDIQKLYELELKRICDRGVGDLEIEKLQLEAAQIEIEDATSALQKISDMSRELLYKASSCIQADYDTAIFPLNDSEIKTSLPSDFGKVKKEVVRLSALTEKLLEEAGIVSDVH